MELFLDNDIILKLAAADLLEKIEELYKVSVSSIYILPSTPFYFRKNHRLEKNYNSETINRAKKAAEKYSVIPDAYNDNDKFQRLAEIEKIDSGEQILYSLTPQTEDFLILTGDKNSIKALNNNNGVEDIKNYLKNKIVFLEELILILIKNEGFQEISKSVFSNSFCFDKVLKTCFEQTNVNEGLVIDCLNSYIKDLKQNCHDLYD